MNEQHALPRATRRRQVTRSLRASGFVVLSALGLAKFQRTSGRGKDGEKARPVLQEPKSPAPKRTFDLDPATVAALRAQGPAGGPPQERGGLEDHDLVFCTGTGGILNPNNVLRTFAAIVERAGVPRIGVHDLRHTHATLLLQAGTPIKAVSERLGHAKTSITLDTYAHVLPDMQDPAVDAIDAALFQRRA